VRFNESSGTSALFKAHRKLIGAHNSCALTFSTEYCCHLSYNSLQFIALSFEQNLASWGLHKFIPESPQANLKNLIMADDAADLVSHDRGNYSEKATADLNELAKKDADDEALNKWKASLGVDPSAAGEGDIFCTKICFALFCIVFVLSLHSDFYYYIFIVRVEMLEFSILSQGRDPISFDLTSPDQLEMLKVSICVSIFIICSLGRDHIILNCFSLLICSLNFVCAHACVRPRVIISRKTLKSTFN
jgi:hypothetical protein